MNQAKTTISIDDLTLDTSLQGDTLKNRIVEIYNIFVYWSQVHAIDYSERKKMEDEFVRLVDVFKSEKAKEAEKLNLKSKIQECYIRDIWNKEMVCFMEQLYESRRRESISRAKCECCKYALDIGRSILSWNKLEAQHISLQQH